MVGYKTEKYRKIGLISAKMDDLANLIPARLDLVFLDSQQSDFTAGFQGRCGVAGGIAISMLVPTKYFSGGSCSWCSGHSAGRTMHVYHGELIEKPLPLEASRPVAADDIQTAISLLYTEHHDRV